MTAMQEMVLVIPTELFHAAGVFQGFCGDVARYLPGLLAPEHLLFLPRADAEADPAYKQIIPYVVLRCGAEVFHYQRGVKGTEARLRALRSVGVGGHISREDAAGSADPYHTGMLREVAEEVAIDSPYQERCIGLINDDSTFVGQVHLGVVHLFDLERPHVHRREDALTDIGFAPLEQLRRQRDQFETWSQFVLEEGVL